MTKDLLEAPRALAAFRDDLQAGLIRRALAVRFARLGDVLFTTPALRQLARGLPGVPLDYLTTGYCRDLVAANPAVDEVLVFDRKWHHPGYLKRKDRLRRELRARSYDLAVVFEAKGSTRRMLEGFLRKAGIRHVVSRSTMYGLPAHVEAAETGDDDPLHACERHSALVETLGFPADERSYELQYTEESLALAQGLLAPQDPPGRERAGPLLVGIQAGCHYSMWPEWIFWNQRYKYHKTWPYQSWGRLGQLLCDRLGARLVITGAGVEQRIGAEIAGAISAPPELEPINLAGRTSVGTLAALIDRLDLFISVDTGSMHMATAMGVPTVALFGPTDPRRHGPFLAGDAATVMRSGLPCSPCKKLTKKACRANLCMSLLEPEAVCQAAANLLERHGRREIDEQSVSRRE